MVEFFDLEMAVEFGSFDGNFAYLNRETGEIYYQGDSVDEQLPLDIDSDKYLEIPSKHSFDSGKALVIAFVSEQLPDDLYAVYNFFRAKGAYAKYKKLLERRGCLETWYQYEQQALTQAIADWCTDNNISHDKTTSPKHSLIANTPKPPYYAVIFTSQRTEHDNGYGKTADRMVELAAGQAGFLGIESARQEVGITVSYWADIASIKRWKANVEHQQAQQDGHKKWYSEFKVRISKVERDYGI